MNVTKERLKEDNPRRYSPGIVVPRSGALSPEKRVILRDIIAERKDALDALAKY